MLVLSRKKEQSVMIGHDIKVTILSIGKESVKIGISAPPSVSVHRKELYDAICEENRQASLSKSLDLALLQRFFSGKAQEHRQKTRKRPITQKK